jgi:hypothetical protein
MGKSKAGPAGQDTTERDGVGAQLAALLNQHQDEIATAWAEMVRGLPGSPYGEVPSEEVDSLTVRGIGAMVESLGSGARAALDEYLADICPAGVEGFPDASSVTEALLVCRDAAVPIILEAVAGDSSRSPGRKRDEIRAAIQCQHPFFDKGAAF